jgi:cell division protein FtsI (penicillin-binding protein 3)
VKKRVLFTFLTCFLISLTLGGRAFYIQIVKDERLAQLAKKQFNSKVIVQARRGAITDRNGDTLAINTDIYSLAANPSKVQNKNTLSRLLSKSLSLSHVKLREKLKEKRDFIWLKRHLREEEIAQFKKWGLSDRMGTLPEGLWLVKESDRNYPHGQLAAPIIGTVNLDGSGVEGIELSQNSRLQGKGSSISAVKDALGRPAFYNPSMSESAKDGEDIQLTLDASLQFSVEEELRVSLEKTKAQSGTVIVMDAVTGDILAMANAPSFNPNLRGQSLQNRRNRALTDGYEPGSTMKSILFAGALEKGMKPTDKFYGENGKPFLVQGRRINEAETHEKFEWMNLQKMIQVSSNVVAAKLALKFGDQNLFSHLNLFGFSKKTGISFPGELSGWLPNRKLKPWQALTTANVGFGHGLMVTPIQMTRAYATFINGGYLVTPRILKNPRPDEEPPAPVRVISEKTSNEVLEALEMATKDEGTGKKARLEGYRVAGKTGTAQTVDPKTKKYSRTRYISSFIGFPLGVSQKLVIYTMLDEPRPIYYAGDTAAPLFREVLNAVVTRFAIPTTENLTTPTLSQTDTHQKSNRPESIVEVSQSHPMTQLLDPEKLELLGTAPDGKKIWRMPNLKGSTLTEALDSLQGAPLRLRAQGNGTVIEQIPAVGEKIRESDLIQLKLSL